MTLTVPSLDDRRFQDLVDDAKRLVQQRCPEWTDHNVSDPGVTLIELFAWMTDQLLYRLNRVPDRHYVKFLELIGVRLFPPTAARAPVTFWLSAPLPETVTIPADTQVATVRTESEPAIVFSTATDLAIVSCQLAGTPLSVLADGTAVDHKKAFAMRNGFRAFADTPRVGDALIFGLDEAVPSCAVRLSFECRTAGATGIDPDDPPLAWEAWTGDGWTACELERDNTGGLNHNGDVIVHVPRGHGGSGFGVEAPALLRVRVAETIGDQKPYRASPEIISLAVSTIGGTAEAINAETVRDEVLGPASGVPGARYPLRRAPVVAGDRPLVIEIGHDGSSEEWQQVPNFAAGAPDDRHFVLDGINGQIEFPPAVRMADGALHRYGAVPQNGDTIRIREYRAGGGSRGNVARRTLTVLKSSIPYVAGVENRQPARGGVDGEPLEAAKVRGPITLRTRDRAVTAEDFEHICREAAPEVARVRCVTGAPGAEAGLVRVLVVPAVSVHDGEFDFNLLVPSEETLEKITRRLDECRLIGTRVLVELPVYSGVKIEAHVRAAERTDVKRLEADAHTALYRYFHPTVGGPDGNGWPFGRPVQAGEVFSVLQRLRGAELVQQVTLYGYDPIAKVTGKATDRLRVRPDALVYSHGHKVTFEEQ